MNKSIKELSNVELKALGYECIIKIEQNQTNIKIINQELDYRAEQSAKHPTDVAPGAENKAEANPQ